ncbi:MAG TPA: DNA polymerase III subunit gamma/tau [Gemmataceae bacterium]|nr:DNA polymerase III subunit gamma/tau [Gemmataceae bacterium]
MAKSQSEYTVMARRYRPQQFDDLVGQETVARALKNALASGRVAHAYLFTGARGVGKTSTARILAKALNCAKGPTPTPCDKCSSCVAIAAGDDIDVREIDGASNRQIDDIRGIRQDVTTMPTRGRYKIYIIDEVHMLTVQAFNALLKTLEEPPPHVKFIFATTDVQKVPITILSRCQRFDFGTIRSEKIVEQLKGIVANEKVQAEDDALEIIARRAGGSMRDAQSLLDQLLAFGGDQLTTNMVQKQLGLAGPERVLALAEAVSQRQASLALDRLNEFAESGLQLAELLDQLIDHWRDLMLVCCAGKEVTDLSTPPRHRETLFQQAAGTNLDTILAGLDILISTKTRLRGSGMAHMLLQMALVRLCRLDELLPLSQVAYWLNQEPGGRGQESGGKGQGAAGTKSETTLVAPPEAKKKWDSLEKTSVAGDSRPASLVVVWPEVIGQIGGILANHLQKAGSPAISAPNALVLSFPFEYNTAYEHCSHPENIERIESALRQRTGQAWKVRLEPKSAPVPGNSGNGKAHLPPAAPVRQRAQDVMQQVPLLKRAQEVLGALPLQIDSGFGTGAPEQPDPVPVPDEETPEE